MRLLREILHTFLMAVIIYIAIQTTLQTFKVYGASMEPTLHNGQYLMVNKAVFLNIKGSYLFHPPRRGEVVVFRPPRSPGVIFIKRIIALPGERVEIRGGRVLVNGKPLAEPYIREAAHYSMPPQTVPEGRYFVLGDNRNESTDSHTRGVGFIPAENILGRAWFSFWPRDEWGWVANYSFAGEER